MFVAELLAIQCRGRLDRSVVTAAILHDIGKVVLSQYLEAGHYKAALSDTGNEAVAERVLIDIDHAEVGAMLAGHWRLPSPIVEAIHGHHCLDGGESMMARAVHLSDFMAHALLDDQDTVNEAGQIERAARTLAQLEVERSKFVERCGRRLEEAGFTIQPSEALTTLCQ